MDPLLHSTVQARQYVFTDLGVLDSSHKASFAKAINNAAEVVGMSCREEDGTGPHAFVFRGGAMHAVATLGGSINSGLAINDHGDVAGTSSIFYESETHAFGIENGTVRDLGTLGGTNSFGAGINNGNRVVGWSEIAGDTATHAFWFRERMYDLGTLGGQNSYATAINIHEQIVGRSEVARGAGNHAFLWEPGNGMRDLGTLGDLECEALCINDHGVIAGVCTADSGAHQAFVYMDQREIHIGDFRPLGINNEGLLVGSRWVRPGETRAVLFAGSNLYDLTDCLVGAPGVVMTEASSINDQEQIAGTARTANGLRACLLKPRPLPPPWVK